MVDIKKKLREKEVPHDLAEAEELLKNHQDLKDEILAGRERYGLLPVCCSIQVSQCCCNPLEKELQRPRNMPKMCTNKVSS